MKTNLSHPCFRSKKKEPFLLNTKFVAVFFVASLLVPLLALIVFSHPGKTDSSGGHYNRSTGEYHYHHGYPAHSHENGICPYDFDDKTASKEATTRNNATTKKSDKYTTEAQYALMTANRNSTKVKTAENETTKNKTTKNSSVNSQSKENSDSTKIRLLIATILVCTMLFVAFIISAIAKCNSKERMAIEDELESCKKSLAVEKEESKKLRVDLFLLKIKNERLNKNFEEEKTKVENLKEDVRLANLDRENYAAECTLSKLRTEYLFVTKHLCNPDYERYYLDSLENLERYTVSPFNTMNGIAPVIADHLLISIKQAEENLNKSTRYSDKTRAAKIADIRRETKELLSKYIQNQYQLEYLLQIFPNLNYLVFVEAPYRNSEIYIQAKENIAKTLPTLKKPTQARWHTFFDICMHYLFEFGSPPVYEMIFQKLVLEITQMEKENSNSIWDLNMQVSSLSLLFAISDGLLKTAKCFCDTEDNEVTVSLRNFSKYCLTKQLEQDGISKDVFDSLIKETEH